MIVSLETMRLGQHGRLSSTISDAAMYKMYLYKFIGLVYNDAARYASKTLMHLLLRSPLSLVSNSRLHHVLIDIPLLPCLVS